MSRVTMWNTRELRKVSGNAAPMEKNVQEYIRLHPEMEVFVAQDQVLGQDQLASKARLSARRVPIWNRKENRVCSGNAAPLEKNLFEYLRKHPDCEVYTDQGKGGSFNQRGTYAASFAPTPLVPAAPTSAPLAPPLGMPTWDFGKAGISGDCVEQAVAGAANLLFASDNTLEKCFDQSQGWCMPALADQSMDVDTEDGTKPEACFVPFGSCLYYGF